MTTTGDIAQDPGAQDRATLVQRRAIAQENLDGGRNRAWNEALITARVRGMARRPVHPGMAYRWVLPRGK